MTVVREAPYILTARRAKEAMKRLEEIHNAGVLHHDAYPRNLAVTAAGQVLWLDFDCAETTAYIEIDQAWFDGEAKLVERRLLWDVCSAGWEGLEKPHEPFIVVDGPGPMGLTTWREPSIECPYSWKHTEFGGQVGQPHGPGHIYNDERLVRLFQPFPTGTTYIPK